MFSGALVVALVSQNISEWFFHKYVLHRLGTKKGSFFHYHWEHHKRCREREENKRDNVDVEYEQLLKSGRFSRMIKKELWLVFGSNLLIALPTYLFFSKYLGIAYLLIAWYYYIAHALSHANNDKFGFLMPWHYEHHCLRNQNQNWCVSFPWFDWVMNTRRKTRH